MISDALLDAVLDTLRTLPFLFAAFLVIEAMEHYSNQYSNREGGAFSGGGSRMYPAMRIFSGGGQSLLRRADYFGDASCGVSLHLR